MFVSSKIKTVLAMFVLVAVIFLAAPTSTLADHPYRYRRPSKTKHIGIGTAIGAIGGALIGGRKGALIGAGAGAGAGYLFYRNKRNKYRERVYYGNSYAPYYGQTYYYPDRYYSNRYYYPSTTYYGYRPRYYYPANSYYGNQTRYYYIERRGHHRHHHHWNKHKFRY
ncbi:MAG: YMGG-like glycine zipper-containing protein [Acidobacteriota bacterium]